MLLFLWLAKGVNAVRGVMVAGSSALLVSSITLVVMYLNARSAGATEEMLFTMDYTWFAPLHINYSVGVDGISVAMLLLSAIRQPPPAQPLRSPQTSRREERIFPTDCLTRPTTIRPSASRPRPT